MNPAKKPGAAVCRAGPAYMLSAGAHGVVLKHFIARELLAAIDVVLEGDRFVTPDVRPDQRQIPTRSL